MEEKLKRFIDSKLESAEKHAKTRADVINLRAQAFGALMFCMENNLIDNTKELSEYWDYTWLIFNRIEKKGK